MIAHDTRFRQARRVTPYRGVCWRQAAPGATTTEAMEIVAVITAITSFLAAAEALFNGRQIAKLIGRVDTLEREIRAR